MITQLELGNIRLFDGIGDWKFPITPLSVLCGTNSAGKSTILKCLLLLQQNHEVSDVLSRSGQLPLAGPLVDLGSYESFVSHHDISKDILIGIGTRNVIKARSVRRGRAKRQVTQQGPEREYISYALNSTFCFGVLESADESSQMWLPHEIPENPLGKGRFTTQAYLKEASFYFEIEDYSLGWTMALRSRNLKRAKNRSTKYSYPQTISELPAVTRLWMCQRLSPGRTSESRLFLGAFSQ